MSQAALDHITTLQPNDQGNLHCSDRIGTDLHRRIRVCSRVPLFDLILCLLARVVGKGILSNYGSHAGGQDSAMSQS
jgi:hypothetical protein